MLLVAPDNKREPQFFILKVGEDSYLPCLENPYFTTKKKQEIYTVFSLS